MPEGHRFRERLLSVVHQSWRCFLQRSLNEMDGDFLRHLEAAPNWIPGVDKCLAAFSVPRSRVRVVWLGESPYPRKESACGLSFYDAKVGKLFRDSGELGTEVNKATSLRNWLKAWFAAIGRLDEHATGRDAIRRMDKSGLIEDLSELFFRGQERGWLWLNAGLSLHTGQGKRRQINQWLPLIEAVLRDASKQGATVVLLGKFAQRLAECVGDPVVAEHPYNESFIRNGDMRKFLREWRSLVETGPTARASGG